MADDPIKIGSASGSGRIMLPDRTRIQKNYDRPDELVRAYLCQTSLASSLTPALYSSDVEGAYSTMYLTGSRVTPGEGLMSELELTYTGTLDGVLPANLSSSGYIVQQASFKGFDSGAYAGVSIDLTYMAKTTSLKKWSMTAVDVGIIGAATPANVTGVWYVAQNLTFKYFTSNPATTIAQDFFTQVVATTGEIEEIVPGKFYSGTQTKTTLLFSNEG